MKMQFSKDEINQDKIISVIENTIDEYKVVSLTEKERRNIVLHTYSQVENIINILFKNNSALLTNNDLLLPNYQVDDNNILQFENSYLKKTNIHNDKDSILYFINDLAVNGTKYALKGMRS